MNRGLWLCALWVGLASAAPADPPAAGGDLDSLRSAIEQSRERVGVIERRERALLESLEELDRALTSLIPEVRRAQADAAQALKAHSDAQFRAARAQAVLTETRAVVSGRVRALFKAGEVGPLRVLFAAETLRELLSRATALRAVVKADAELAARHRRRWNLSASASEAARAAAKRHERAVATLARHQDALAVERGSKRTLLAHVRSNRSQERALLVELERAARALEETLAALGASPRRRGLTLDGSGFSSRIGRLDFPVSGGISHAFGRVVDAEFRTETFRKGVKFGVAEGDSVRAVAPGEVRFSGWFRGYGQIVILDHGDGYFTVYGHLGELFVEVGDLVSEDDTIGSAGETGSLTGPSLYFELRRGGEPLDPALWFRPVARG